MQKNSGSQEALVKEGQVYSKFLVHTHPEMQQLGFKHLQEVLVVEPAFYVHSIANRRSCILAVEYVCNGRSSKLCWSFT